MARPLHVKARDRTAWLHEKDYRVCRSEVIWVRPYERGMYYGDAATNPSPQGELRSVIIPKQTQAQLTRDFEAEVLACAGRNQTSEPYR